MDTNNPKVVTKFGLKRLCVGNQAKDAAREQTAPKGRASKVEEASRQMVKALEKDTRQASKEKQAAALAARKARLAQAVKSVEKGVPADESSTPETLYALPSNIEKLNYVTDSLLMGCSSIPEMNSGVDVDDAVNDSQRSQHNDDSLTVRNRKGEKKRTTGRNPNAGGPSNGQYDPTIPPQSFAEIRAAQATVAKDKAPVATEKPKSYADVVRTPPPPVDMDASVSRSARNTPDDPEIAAATGSGSDPVTEHLISQAVVELSDASLNDRNHVQGTDAIEIAKMQNLVETMVNQRMQQHLANTPQPAMEQIVAQVGNLVQQVVELKACPPASDSNPVSRNVVRVNDIKMTMFYGNDDPKASCITQPYFLPLIRWIKEAKALLAHSGLNVSAQSTVVLNHLAGAARASFFARYGTVDRSAWTLDTMFTRIAHLIPDYEVIFTREALEMTFNVRSLVDDIDTFAMYLRYGSFPLNGNQYIFTELQKKMLDAYPRIFTLAADLHNLRLVWNRDRPFMQFVNTAIEIVNTLQANQQLLINDKQSVKPQEAPGKRKAPPSEGQRSQYPKRPKREGKQGSGNSKRAKFVALAKEYKRCIKCGMHIPNGDWKSHASDRDPKTKCKPELFTTRMGKVASLVAQGKADQVNEFTKK